VKAKSKKKEMHGLSKHKLYKAWHNMRSRCKNPNASKYYLYGGKGIFVCDEWDNDFLNFYNWSMENGWREGLTLDRIDGNKNYCPDNCRWATYKQQNNNTTQNRWITFNGKRHNVTQWAKIVGLSEKCLSERIRRKWSIERALTTPTIRFENFGKYVQERKEQQNV
jgi:hypothetical protein